MPTTPVYGWRYQPLTGVRPDGAALGENLALDIEVDVSRIDGVLAMQPDEQLFTLSGTWTKPTGARVCYVEVQAGGGSGGGANITTAGQWSFGDGGGGGEWAGGWFDANVLAATVAVTVGVGGVGASGAQGTGGGTSSFGAHITALGGGAGNIRAATNAAQYSPNTVSRAGGSGGTGGTLRIAGSPGGMGIGIASATSGVRGGDGGASHMGAGRIEVLNGAGNAGRNYGGGGSAAANSASQGAARTGGDGAPGAVRITTFF